MKIFTSALQKHRAIVITALLGIAAQANGQIVFRLPQIVIPQPVVVVQPTVVAQPAIEVGSVPEDYAPNPFDTDIVNVAPADVVIMNGNTYIWANDPNGVRYQRFYAEGDHRQEVFARREELHRVMTRNGGHLPLAHNEEVRRQAEVVRGTGPATRLATAANKNSAVPANKNAAAPANKGAVAPAAPANKVAAAHKDVKQEDHK